MHILFPSAQLSSFMDFFSLTFLCNHGMGIRLELEVEKERFFSQIITS